MSRKKNKFINLVFRIMISQSGNKKIVVLHQPSKILNRNIHLIHLLFLFNLYTYTSSDMGTYSNNTISKTKIKIKIL